MEHQLRFHFFEIFKALLGKLKVSKDRQQCLSLLDATSWKFGSRDHQMIANLDVFKILRFGDGHRKNLLRRSWGRKLISKVKAAEDAKDDLTAEVLNRFEYLFFGLVSRIVD